MRQQQTVQNKDSIKVEMKVQIKSTQKQAHKNMSIAQMEELHKIMPYNKDNKEDELSLKYFHCHPSIFY